MFILCYDMYMAQTLKPEVRDSIIKVAKEEFLINGYDNTSMRSIANNCHMTVGNLYRYFKNKEDIHNQIVGNTLNKLTNIIKSLPKNSVSLETRVFSVKFNVQELSDTLDLFSERMVSVYMNNKSEFNILLSNSDYNKQLIDWFCKVISDLITISYGGDEHIFDIEVLSKSYAVSIFSGFKEMFSFNNVQRATLLKLCKAYFRSYIYLLDSDIKKFIDE